MHPFCHQKSPTPLKTNKSAERKFLRFMKGNRQRRLLAERPELSNPPPGFTRCRGLFSPTRGPGESRSPAALAASASGYPRNLNCSATRKRSRPVDGRRPQTFDPPGRLLGSAAQHLLAPPASLGDRACCLQTTAPSETARPIAAGCRSVGGMARLFGSRSG